MRLSQSLADGGTQVAMLGGGTGVRSTLEANGDIRIGKTISRRLLYGGSFLVCLMMLIVSLDFSSDFSSSRLPGTLIIFVMTAASFWAAAWERRIVIKAETRQILISRQILGIHVGGEGPYQLDSVGLIKVVLYRKPENLRGPVLLPRRDRILHRLFLYHSNGSVLVDEARDGEELIELGRGIAEQGCTVFEMKTM